MMHLRRPGRSFYADLVEVDAARGTKTLDQQMKSDELVVMRHATWGLSGETIVSWENVLLGSVEWKLVRSSKIG